MSRRDYCKVDACATTRNRYRLVPPYAHKRLGHPRYRFHSRFVDSCLYCTIFFHDYCFALVYHLSVSRLQIQNATFCRRIIANPHSSKQVPPYVQCLSSTANFALPFKYRFALTSSFWDEVFRPRALMPLRGPSLPLTLLYAHRIKLGKSVCYWVTPELNTTTSFWAVRVESLVVQQ